MKKTYTRKEVIKLLVDERTRARDIAYEFKEEYDRKAQVFGDLGELKKHAEKTADVARQIGNAISGSNALSATLGETIEDRIVKMLDDEGEV